MTFETWTPLYRDCVCNVKVSLDFSLQEWQISHSAVTLIMTGDRQDLLKSNYSSDNAKHYGSALPDTETTLECSLKIPKISENRQLKQEEN